MADAALMDPSQIGQNITNSFLQGMDRGQQAATQGALAAYVQNPSDKTAIEVARVNPAMGMQLRDRQQQLQAAEQAKDIKVKAAAGDPQAIAQVAGIDFGLWLKMDDQQHQAIAERTKYIGQAALRISQLPESDRPAAWDQAVTQGSQYFPDLAQYKGQYSPQALQSAVDHAGLVMDLIQTTRPSYQVVPEGGTMVNTHDPQAVTQYSGSQPSQVQPAGAQVPAILKQATASGMISPEEAQAVSASLGPNGQAAFQGWMQKNNVKIAKQLGGQTYYQVNGQWFDNPEGH